MTFEEYKNSGLDRYSSLAKTVKTILCDDFSANNKYHILAIQSRAKSIESLKARLEESGELDTKDLQSVRKDLAGCRIIFYTNSSLENFMYSHKLNDLFELESDSFKSNDPGIFETDPSKMFEGLNVVVKLRETADSANYDQYKNCFCEIQIQTVFSHIWSELSHDTFYKIPKPITPPIQRALDENKPRLAEIRNTFLVPASRATQRMYNDFERARKQKPLFDRELLTSTVEAKDNNSRFEAVSKLKIYLKSKLDELDSEATEILTTLEEAWRKAEKTKPQPTQNKLEWFGVYSSQDVIDAIVEILDLYAGRFPEKIYSLIVRLYDYTDSQNSRKHLLELTKNVVRYNYDSVDKTGPMIQLAIAHLMKHDTDTDSISDVVISIAHEILATEVEGSSFEKYVVTVKSKSLRYSETLSDSRRLAIDSLFSIYQKASQFETRNYALSELFAAIDLPRRTNYEDSLAQMVLNDAIYILERLLNFPVLENFDQRQNFEYKLYDLWRWSKLISKRNNFSSHIMLLFENLEFLIFKFRDELNLDTEFAIFKTIVGFRSVFQPHWEINLEDTNEESDHTTIVDTFRSNEQKKLVNEIEECNYLFWKERIKRAFSVISHDLATFPPLIKFLDQVAEKHSALVFDLLCSRDELPDWTTRTLASALIGTDHDTQTRKVMSKWITESRFLPEMSAILFSLKSDYKTLTKAIVKRTIREKSQLAMNILTEVSARRFEEDQFFWRDEVFFPIVEQMIQLDDLTWVDATYFLSRGTSIYATLNKEQATTLMTALVSIQEFEYKIETVLTSLVFGSHDHILSWIYMRLKFSQTDKVKGYRPIPDGFSFSNEILQQHPKDVIAEVRKWYEEFDIITHWEICYFLSKVFLGAFDKLEVTLLEFVKSGDIEDLKFIVSCLDGFEGDSKLMPVLRAILVHSNSEKDVLDGVKRIFEQSPGTAGKDGFRKECQEKIELLKPWRDDENSIVREFAINNISLYERRSEDGYR